MKKLKLQKAAKTFLMVLTGTFFSTCVWADNGWSDALRYKSEDGDLRIKLGGRFHYDIAHIDADRDTENTTRGEWRRARLNLSGRVNDWRYRTEYDFSSSSNSSIKDAYIGYRGFENVRIRIGHQLVPQSLEELTNSKAITFSERALPNALVQGFKLGATAKFHGKRWTYNLGVFEGRLQGRNDRPDSGWGVVNRFTYIVPKRGNELYHFGGSFEHRDSPKDKRLRFSSRPEVRNTRRRPVSTGTLSDVDYTVTSGLEFAYLNGPLTLQTEYIRTDVLRDGREDVKFDGWHISGAWFLFGGRAKYDRKDGVFDPPRIRGENGAMEFAFRVSHLDLQNDPITGGEATNISLGLNYYFSNKNRIMMNWVTSKADPNRSGDVEDFAALQLRLQAEF